MATRAFSTGIAGIDSAGDDSFIPCLVLGIAEDAPLHPESPLALASTAILALGRLEVPQVFKHQDGRLMLFGKLDNTSTHQVRDGLIYIAYLLPKSNIILLSPCDNASLASVACDPS